MNVLVTGGAGFIGSHVADAYVAKGYRVAIVDNLSSGSRANLNPAAQFYEIDVGDPSLDEVLARERPEIVCHHAAQIDVQTSIRDPELDIRSNIIALVRLASSCVRHGVGVLVFASTAAVYGTPSQACVPEAAPVRPTSPYGIDKRAGELYVQYFGSGRGMKTSVLRYANVYGPRQDSHGEAGVVAIFVGNMLTGRRSRIFGDGSQQRDFIYVGDVVRACLAASEAPSPDAINIGTGTLSSVSELHRELSRITGFSEPAVKAPPRPGEVHSISLDPSLAGERLGWQAETELKVGLELTVDFYRRARHM